MRIKQHGLLAFLLLVTPVVLQAQQFSYTITTNLTITITAYNGPSPSATIPSSINGLPVTAIESFAFQPQSGVTNISVPATLTNIAEAAFNSWSLLAIIVDINNGAYSSSGGVLFDKDQTTLIQFPFARGGNYTIPSGVVKIGQGAFQNCPQLAGVTFPNGVVTISSYAFHFCTALTNLSISDSVTDIGFYAFAACGLTNVTLGRGVTNIESGAFYDCTNLNTVQIPSSVTSIGWGAFVDCYSLRDITLPNSVVYLGDQAFFNCTNLTNATLGTGITNISPDTFHNCSSLLNAPIGDGILNIEAGAFQNCASLCSVVIPGSVTNVGANAFSGCTGLGNAIIDAPTLGELAFYACFNLTNVIIGNDVTNIGESGFMSCSNLATVTIGKNVGNIGGAAFAQCPNLAAVYFQGTPPLLGCCNSTPCCVFGTAPHSILYFLPGVPGWGTTFGDRPALPISLQILEQDGNLGVRSNQFGFNVTGTYGLPAVVEGTTNLVNPSWSPLQTNSLFGGSWYFSDPQWTNSPRRFYRVRWP